MPLPLVSAALAAVKLLEEDTSFRKRLFENTAEVRQGLRDSGIGVEDEPGPIISLVPRNAREAASIKARLVKENIYPSFIQYPGGPANGHFRFVISSEHTRDQLDRLIQGICAAEGFSNG